MYEEFEQYLSKVIKFQELIAHIYGIKMYLCLATIFQKYDFVPQLESFFLGQSNQAYFRGY